MWFDDNAGSHTSIFRMWWTEANVRKLLDGKIFLTSKNSTGLYCIWNYTGNIPITGWGGWVPRLLVLPVCHFNVLPSLPQARKALNFPHDPWSSQGMYDNIKIWDQWHPCFSSETLCVSFSLGRLEIISGNYFFFISLPEFEIILKSSQMCSLSNILEWILQGDTCLLGYHSTLRSSGREKCYGFHSYSGKIFNCHVWLVNLM